MRAALRKLRDEGAIVGRPGVGFYKSGPRAPKGRSEIEPQLRELARGVEPGQRLPPTNELMITLRATRQVVNSVLRGLAREGVVQERDGAGGGSSAPAALPIRLPRARSGSACAAPC